ncbi:MAG: abortive infection family protein [Candidatus Acidiferrum sp.]
MTRLFLFGLQENWHYQDTDPLEADVWERYRRNGLRYLRASNAAPGTMLMLQELPFSCEWAVFHDEFEGYTRSDSQVLVLRVPVEVFVEIELERGNWDQRIAQGIPEAVHGLNRVGCNIKWAVAEIELDAENRPIEILQAKDLHITSATVEHALSQARTLIVSHGASAALDRVHTVFHAYLKAVCDGAQLQMPNDHPGIIQLLGLLRRDDMFLSEPDLKDLVNQTLKGIQKAVDALETFRNEFSLVHPQEMLPEPEALFVINVTQAMLRYLDARLR